MAVSKIFKHCNSTQKSGEQGKQQKNVNLSVKHLLSQTPNIYTCKVRNLINKNV